MALFRNRKRPLKSALANAEQAAVKANSAAGKADDVMTAAAKEFDEVLDLLDDPQELGRYLWEVGKGVFFAAKADTTRESLDMFQVILKLFHR